MSNSITSTSTQSSRATTLVLLALLICAVSGCRSTFRTAPFSQRASQERAQVAPQPDQVVASDHALENDRDNERESEFQNPEVPEIPPMTPALSEEEVVAIFREAGGKLRPDDSGAIVEIDLSFGSITDTQLSLIDRFPETSELDLTGTEIADDAIPALVSLPNLRAVKLKGTKISDAGLRALSGMSSLILIDASNTTVTDDGLTAASGWVSLRYLSLNSTSVSDAGLQHLETLQELRGLSVINTLVTEDGVRQLKEKLPNCLIVAQGAREVSDSGGSDSMPRLADPEQLGSAVAGMTSRRQLEQLLQIAESQPHLAVHLSEIYSSREQWKEASQILAAAAAANPEDRAVQFALGQALARSGRPEEALPHFEQAVDEATARYQVAMIVYENSLKRCERLFDQALSADPGLEVAEARRQEIQNELAHLRRGRKKQPSRSPADIDSREDSLEVVPAPPVRNASHSRAWMR